MARVTRITGPDGRVTVIKTTSGCGCLTALAAIIVVFGPAAWFGAWAIPAYIGLGALIVALLAVGVAKAKQERQPRSPQPPPAPAPPPL